jgi:LuxR family maltose regulon positive regulatory protein
LEWLERQEQAIQARGWTHWEIRLRLVECLARQKIGDTPGAQAAVQRALELGEPGGYVRLFVEEGEPLRSLLAALLKNMDKESPYWRRLLAAFPLGSRQAAPPPAPCQSLAEPLTAREIEVLRLISQGLSNQEIAGKLVVTLNTVKKHNYSIFQKLGVTNRAQAILAAQEMGLGKEESTKKLH